MDELDEGCSFNVSCAVGIAGPPGKDHQQRSQTLTAAGDDVLGNTVDQGYRTLKPGPDDRVHGGKVGVDNGSDFYKGHECQAG